MKELIKKLTTTPSPSGREEKIKQIILEELQGYIDGYKIDKLGNLIVWKKGKKEGKILLDAHMDEIGVLATYIDEKGFIRIEPIGGISPYNLLGSSIQFPDIEGFVGVEGETSEEMAKNIKNLDFDKIFIDIGAKSKEEAERLVPPGTFGVYSSSFRDLGDRIVSKAMDDRIGCAIIIEVFKRSTPIYDLYGSFSVQEEVGLVGASVVAFDIQPDVAIAVDVTAHSDTPKGLKRISLELGKGPAIKIKDSASISDRRLVEKLKYLAEKNQIPYQIEILLRGGTNAAVLQRTKAGIIAGTLSIPTRYVHSPHEMVDIMDVENAVNLLKIFVESEESINL
jgi:endoglucanase